MSGGKVVMAKDVINVDGEDRVVREDTAKSFRGVYWALFSIIGFLIVAALMLFVAGSFSLSGGDVNTPAETEQRRQ